MVYAGAVGWVQWLDLVLNLNVHFNLPPVGLCVSGPPEYPDLRLPVAAWVALH